MTIKPRPEEHGERRGKNNKCANIKPMAELDKPSLQLFKSSPLWTTSSSSSSTS